MDSEGQKIEKLLVSRHCETRGTSDAAIQEHLTSLRLLDRLLQCLPFVVSARPKSRNDARSAKTFFSPFNAHFSQCKAFSLAEVLITLGIIGVLAAITIPNLIANYQKDQTVTQLKSVYTTLNNALEQAKVENGTDVDNWYIPDDSEASASAYFGQNYLLPYLKTTQVCGSSTTTICTHKVGVLSNLTSETKSYNNISGNSNSYSFTLVNGAIVQVKVYSITGTSVSKSRVVLYFDINGRNLPNIMGKDVFIVELGGNYGTGNKNKFVPYALEYLREILLNGGDATCCNKTSGSGARCFAVIMKDGWKIADDYPW